MRKLAPARVSYWDDFFISYSMLPSIRTLETKAQFLRRPFQFSVNKVFQMKAEHFSFKMKVLAI